MEYGIIEKLKELYGDNSNAINVFFAPGRVNLIGEHIDYNGGYVFPCALDFGTYLAVRRRNDRRVLMHSLNFPLKIELDLDSIEYNKKDDWGNYPKGIIKGLMDMGNSLGGLEMVFQGNIPNGAGLSSSASIELVTAAALNSIFDLKLDMITLVKLSQRSENVFNNVNCGIMDQFAVGMGKNDHAILLNCETLQYEYVPLLLDGYSLVISNTNKRRELQDSKYNERRSECERALKRLNSKLNIKNLCELSSEDFNTYSHLIENEILFKRARHVVFENERVLKAVEALRENDISTFGRLMVESHNSLREDYEVTGIELDTLVYEALKLNGVKGSRMTGAGFGGCTISIVKNENVEEFREKVTEGYKGKIGYEPTIYVANVGMGAHRVI